ncbi:MAG TPA: triose-phosphate isomerase [Clostridiaceae bacterium]|nr:triose-phosphate isomerase [Clostridiaceae bacterium]
MKKLPASPFFETSVKNYIYGQDAIDYALAVEEAANKYDVDALFISPLTEIRTIAEKTERLIIIAAYMDPIRPGRGIADILPEAIKAAGAHGVLLNHIEKPMSLKQIEATIIRANELDLISFACADSIAEARAIAQFNPDIINPEPSELIGSGQASDMTYVIKTLEEVKKVSPDILVEQAAGITKSSQIYDFIMAGNDGAGSASGILKSPDPYALLDEMIYYVSLAKKELNKVK